jgi:hypothetical protein
MITIEKNPSFPQWFRIFCFGELIDEVNGRAKALRLAKHEAQKKKQTHVIFLGEILDIND